MIYLKYGDSPAGSLSGKSIGQHTRVAGPALALSGRIQGVADRCVSLTWVFLSSPPFLSLEISGKKTLG